ELAAAGNLPHLRAVVAAGGQRLAVGRKRDAIDRLLLAGELAEVRGRGQVPEMDGGDGPAEVADVVGRGQRLAVGGEGEAGHAPLALAERAHLLAAGDVPDTDAAVGAAGDQRLAVAGEDHRQ